MGDTNVVSRDIHGYFGLTYANYLVMPRALLQSMPEDWQERFVKMLEEFDDAFASVPKAHGYEVRAKSVTGQFARDPVPYYDRGRTYVEPRMPDPGKPMPAPEPEPPPGRKGASDG